MGHEPLHISDKNQHLSFPSKQLQPSLMMESVFTNSSNIPMPQYPASATASSGYGVGYFAPFSPPTNVSQTATAPTSSAQHSLELSPGGTPSSTYDGQSILSATRFPVGSSTFIKNENNVMKNVASSGSLVLGDYEAPITPEAPPPSTAFASIHTALPSPMLNSGNSQEVISLIPTAILQKQNSDFLPSPATISQGLLAYQNSPPIPYMAFNLQHIPQGTLGSSSSPDLTVLPSSLSAFQPGVSYFDQRQQRTSPSLQQHQLSSSMNMINTTAPVINPHSLNVSIPQQFIEHHPDLSSYLLAGRKYPRETRQRPHLAVIGEERNGGQPACTTSSTPGFWTELDAMKRSDDFKHRRISDSSNYPPEGLSQQHSFQDHRGMRIENHLPYNSASNFYTQDIHRRQRSSYSPNNHYHWRHQSKKNVHPLLPISPEFEISEDDIPRDVRSSLMIFYLPKSWTLERLRKTFEPYGQVLQYRLDIDPEFNSHKGRGFVQFDTPEAAQRALQAVDGMPVEEGRRLKVQMKRFLPNRYRHAIRQAQQARQRPGLTLAGTQMSGNQQHNAPVYDYRELYFHPQQLIPPQHSMMAHFDASSPNPSVVPRFGGDLDTVNEFQLPWGGAPGRESFDLISAAINTTLSLAKAGANTDSRSPAAASSSSLPNLNDRESPGSVGSGYHQDNTSQAVSSELRVENQLNYDSAVQLKGASPNPIADVQQPQIHTNWTELGGMADNGSVIGDDHRYNEIFTINRKVTSQNQRRASDNLPDHFKLLTPSLPIYPCNDIVSRTAPISPRDPLSHSPSTSENSGTPFEFYHPPIPSHHPNDSAIARMVPALPFGVSRDTSSLAEPCAPQEQILRETNFGFVGPTSSSAIIPENNLFVFHIPPDWNEYEFRRHFSQFGPIRRLSFPKDSSTPWGHRGYGFVCYDRHADACAAIAEMDGKEIEVGRRLKVELKKPVNQRLRQITLQSGPKMENRVIGAIDSNMVGRELGLPTMINPFYNSTIAVPPPEFELNNSFFQQIQQVEGGGGGDAGAAAAMAIMMAQEQTRLDMQNSGMTPAGDVANNDNNRSWTPAFTGRQQPPPPYGSQQQTPSISRIERSSSFGLQSQTPDRWPSITTGRPDQVIGATPLLTTNSVVSSSCKIAAAPPSSSVIFEEPFVSQKQHRSEGRELFTKSRRLSSLGGVCLSDQSAEADMQQKPIVVLQDLDLFPCLNETLNVKSSNQSGGSKLTSHGLMRRKSQRERLANKLSCDIQQMQI